MDEKVAFDEILEGLEKGKYVVWEHDGIVTGLTPEYLETHFVGFVQTPEEGYTLCRCLHRYHKSRGEGLKTYMFANGQRDEHVVVPDLTPEEADAIRRRINKEMREPPNL